MLFNCYRKVDGATINATNPIRWIRDLCNTQIINKSRGKKVSKYNNKAILWGTEGCRWVSFGNDVYGNIIIGARRNDILRLLLDEQRIQIDSNPNAEGFWEGKIVNFKYNNNFFQWYGTPNDQELDIYLMESDWSDYKKHTQFGEHSNTDKEKYYCFRVTDNMITKEFCEEMDKLIEESEE